MKYRPPGTEFAKIQLTKLGINSPHFCTAHQELMDFSDKTVVDVGFQSENFVAQVVEGPANVLHPRENDNEDTLIQTTNTTIQSTKMLSQLMQQIQQTQTLMA